jgi:hypothetical protein
MESTVDLMDTIFSGGSPEEVSDKIKEILFNKSASKIENITPYVAKSMFGDNQSEE